MIFVYPFKTGHVSHLFPRRHGKSPAFAQFFHVPLDMPSKFRRERLDEGAAVWKRSAVQVHQPRDALGDTIRRARNHDARVAVPKERDIMEILELDEVHHVGAMSV